MKFKRDPRRGVSLAETSVALAVLAVVSTIAVSFAVLIGGRVGVGRARLDAVEEFEMIKNVTETWLDEMLADGAFVYVNDAGNGISAELGSETYALSFVDGKLSYNLSSGSDTVYAARAVTEVKFSVMRNSNDAIYFCTVVYSDGAGGETEEVFAVNPTVGETFKVETDTAETEE